MKRIGSVALVALVVSACQVIGGFEDFAEGDGSVGSGGASGAVGSGGSGGSGGSAGAAAGSGGAAGASGGTTGSGGSSGASGSGGGAGMAPCPNESDPGLHGSPMSLWQRLDGSCFWMDRTEATAQDYLEFVAANGGGGAPGDAGTADAGSCTLDADCTDVTTPKCVDGKCVVCRDDTDCSGTTASCNTLNGTCVQWPTQEGECNWNGLPGTGGAPGAAGPAPGLAPNRACLNLSADPGLGDPQLPIVCVDWCDAKAFCQWAGKELCKDTNVSPDFSKADKSNWFAVCSGNGADDFPYGDTYNQTACNGTNSPTGCTSPGTCRPVHVGTLTGCKRDTWADLSGNVAEWTTGCTSSDESGQCNTRGGSFNSGSSALVCAGNAQIARKATQITVGFRCCASTGGGASDAGAG